MAAVPALSNTHHFLKSPLPLPIFFFFSFCRSLDVWIGFNDFASSGAQQRGEGFNLESCQNWLPGEPHPSNADHCVRMGPTGQCNTDLCMAKHSYVCEYKPQGGLCWPCCHPGRAAGPSLALLGMQGEAPPEHHHQMSVIRDDAPKRGFQKLKFSPKGRVWVTPVLAVSRRRERSKDLRQSTGNSFSLLSEQSLLLPGSEPCCCLDVLHCVFWEVLGWLKS